MSDEIKGKPGRPANFPGIKVETFVSKLPADTMSAVRTFAENREVPLGVALNTLLQRALRQTERKRSAK